MTTATVKSWLAWKTTEWQAWLEEQIKQRRQVFLTDPDEMTSAFNRERDSALLARVGDKYYAADNRCPHMGGKLSPGKLEGTVVTCPRHGSQFDLTRRGNG